MNNLGWIYLELHDLAAEEIFREILDYWTNPTDWKHHWAKLGLALSNALESGDFVPAESIIADLTNLLGAEHDRVSKACSKLENTRAFYQLQRG